MKKGYLRNVVNEAYVTGQSNRFAIDICFRRKGDEMSTRQEKHTMAEDIVNDLESSSYFEGNDVKIEERNISMNFVKTILNIGDPVSTFHFITH